MLVTTTIAISESIPNRAWKISIGSRSFTCKLNNSNSRRVGGANLSGGQLIASMTSGEAASSVARVTGYFSTIGWNALAGASFSSQNLMGL